MHASGPGYWLIVEDSEGKQAISDEDYLESIYLQEKKTHRESIKAVGNVPKVAALVNTKVKPSQEGLHQ